MNTLLIFKMKYSAYTCDNSIFSSELVLINVNIDGVQITITFHKELLVTVHLR